MEKRGAKRVETVGGNDKRQIMEIFCSTMLGDFFYLCMGGSSKKVQDARPIFCLTPNQLRH